MNWRKLLLFDMRRLWPGHTPEGPPARPLQWLPWRRRRTQETEARDFQPGVYYRACTSMLWRGPVYINGGIWRRDLLGVVNQLTAMAKVNAPFHRGLEALARDQRRSALPLQGIRTLRLSVALMISCAFLSAFLVFGSSAGILDKGDFLTLTFLLVSFMGALLPASLVMNRGGAREALLLRMRDHLESGRTLSEMMRRFPRFFPKFYADLVEAGETSGQLAAALEGLSEDTLRRITLRRALRPVVWYLLIVLSIQVILLSFIIAKVVPVFAEMLRETAPSASLPWVVQMAQSLGDTVYHAGHVKTFELAGNLLMMALALIGLGFLGLGPLGLRIRRHYALSTCGIGLLAFPIPGLRRILIQQNLVVASVILEKLLKAGMPLDAALERVEQADLLGAYKHLFRNVRLRVIQGETFSDALKRCAGPGLVPRLFQGVSALGERAGMLPEALARLAELYQSNVEKRIRILYDSILPAGVVVLGCLSLFGELLVFTTLISVVDSLMVI